MNPIVEKLVIWILGRILTPDVIKGAEKDFVEFLLKLAEKTPNQIDNALVLMVAEALGVEVK